MSRVRSITRRTGSRRPAVRIAIVMEGSSTEPEYLKVFNRIFGNQSVRLELIGGAGVPRSVVERATKELQRCRRDPLGSQDSVWAMFDRDAHPGFAEAKNMAQGNDIGLAVSNPCFELWGIFHYRDNDGPIDRHECQRALAKLCPAYSRKGNKLFGDPEVVEASYANAVARATESVARREADGDPAGNPSTTVHHLTEFIRSTVDRLEREQ